MPYARANWRSHELKIALANPTHSAAGPHAHSSKHGVTGDLAKHPLFQRARVTAHIIDDNSKYSNQKYFERGADGTWIKNADGTNVHSNNTRKNNPIPKPEVGGHSTLNVEAMAKALKRAFNHASLQPYLAILDGGNDMKVTVNFNGADIGQGYFHDAAGTTQVGFQSLFIYCKPNPGNKDVPIFQTVVPKQGHSADGVTV